MNYIPKVVIIGNCQSKPLGAILSRLFDIDVTAEILVHRASDSEKPRYLPLIEAADHIISQHSMIPTLANLYELRKSENQPKTAY